jgi:hypothetical protein
MTLNWFKQTAMVVFITLAVCAISGSVWASETFRFTVTSDPQYKPEGFREVCKQIRSILGDHGAFHITTGDQVPPQDMWDVLRDEFGPQTIWYPVTGNHEGDDPAYIQWVRDRYPVLPYIVNGGPPNGETTTYSFDYGNAHFVILNVFYDGEIDIHRWKTNGIADPLYHWLVDDLERNTKPLVFVFGHKPAFVIPDDYFNETRHREHNGLGENPANRDRFWRLLSEKGVMAYLSGHTHFYSTELIDGVWQVDCAEAQHTKYSAFIDVQVDGGTVTFTTYRDVYRTGVYQVYESWTVTAEIRSEPPESPSRLDVFVVSGSEVALTWVDNSNNENGFNIERKMEPSGLYSVIATVDANTTIYTDTDITTPAMYYYRVRAFNDDGYSGYSNEGYVVIDIPPSYISFDIGTMTIGSTADVGGFITVEGSGSQLWADADGFRYVCNVDLTGSVSIIAKVEDFPDVYSPALAGIMVRQNLGSNAFYSGIFIQNDGKVRSQYRNQVLTSIDYLGEIPESLPIWLKIEKSDADVISTFSSLDGVEWVKKSQRSFNKGQMKGGFTAGLVVSSGQEGALAAATFSNVDWSTGTVSSVQSRPQYSNILGQNFPNPFNSITSIPYTLESAGDVNIIIFDVKGRTIWQTSILDHQAGIHAIQWDARNIKGQRVPSGLYFYRISVKNAAGTFTDRKKMVLLF